VVGIVFILVSGWAALALDPGTPWTYVLGIFFGAGAALTLDEFALWLNMKDVYWQHRGRQSIEAAGAFVAILALGLLVRSYGSAVWKARRSRGPG